ncbi:hypothetical protein Dsin_005276 [Dipteronia sinensis]|uniref:Exonuclease domain-containing protein n=1 Tax=Dipteronia sinensis TaxID=43782 RepID=A0AAE0EES0_9ROSI|nr:hypothetical protein Dsin_005276 [Dipteronia sinensis]
MGENQYRSEIAFFDVETTVPTRQGQGFAILEFGAILVCPKKLEELDSYSTLVRPADPSLISSLSVRCNGITPDSVVSAPTFADIADKVYDILQGTNFLLLTCITFQFMQFFFFVKIVGRIWAGHNIVRFDCARIREAFSEVGKPAPEPKGTIDSLALLTQKFGRRAGDMKMATLATYFGLGQQSHRSLDDVRMNLEVLKYCATVLFLESSLPDIFTVNSWVSPNATTRSRRNIKSSPEGTSQIHSTPSSKLKFEDAQKKFPTDQKTVEDRPILSLVTHRPGEEISNVALSGTDKQDPFDMGALSNQMETKSIQPDVTMEEKSELESPEISSTAVVSEGSSGYAGFVDPDEVVIPSVNACLVPLFEGSQIQRMKLLHKAVILQLCCSSLRVRFGISTKFVDQAGRPRLNFVVDATPSLCKVLEACDNIAQKFAVESGSSSEWRPVLTRKNGYFNFPTTRLHIPTVVHGDSAQYATEIYQKEATNGTIQKLVFQKFDAAELESLIKPGTFVDGFLSLDPYDYQQSAGIRIVATKLIIHPE